MGNPLFLGNDASADPAVSDLLRVAHALAKEGAGEGALSSRFGLRSTMSVAKPLEGLGPKDFVEVADYDPHRDHTLVIGPVAPHPFSGLHALVLRAKREVGAIVQVALPEDHPALARAPRAEKGRTTLDLALAVLERLREGPVVAFGKWHLLAAGRSPDEAREHLAQVLRG